MHGIVPFLNHFVPRPIVGNSAAHSQEIRENAYVGSSHTTSRLAEHARSSIDNFLKIKEKFIAVTEQLWNTAKTSFKKLAHLVSRTPILTDEELTPQEASSSNLPNVSRSILSRASSFFYAYNGPRGDSEEDHHSSITQSSSENFVAGSLPSSGNEGSSEEVFDTDPVRASPVSFGSTNNVGNVEGSFDIVPLQRLPVSSNYSDFASNKATEHVYAPLSSREEKIETLLDTFNKLEKEHGEGLDEKKLKSLVGWFQTQLNAYSTAATDNKIAEFSEATSKKSTVKINPQYLSKISTYITTFNEKYIFTLKEKIAEAQGDLLLLKEELKKMNQSPEKTMYEYKEFLETPLYYNRLKYKYQKYHTLAKSLETSLEKLQTDLLNITKYISHQDVIFEKTIKFLIEKVKNTIDDMLLLGIFEDSIAELHSNLTSLSEHLSIKNNSIHTDKIQNLQKMLSKPLASVKGSSDLQDSLVTTLDNLPVPFKSMQVMQEIRAKNIYLKSFFKQLETNEFSTDYQLDYESPKLQKFYTTIKKMINSLPESRDILKADLNELEQNLERLLAFKINSLDKKFKHTIEDISSQNLKMLSFESKKIFIVKLTKIYEAHKFLMNDILNTHNLKLISIYLKGLNNLKTSQSDIIFILQSLSKNLTASEFEEVKPHLEAVFIS